MVSRPLDLYDEDVGARLRWALREGLVLGGILLFWVALAVALSLILAVVSVPFALLRWGAPGLPVAAVVWTLVGPLAAANAGLYALARVGTVLLDQFRSEDGVEHVLTRSPGYSSSDAHDADGRADDGHAAGEDGDVEGVADGDEDGDEDEDGDDEVDGDGDEDGDAP